MEFSKFELSLLLLLVEGQISDLKFKLLELRENKLFMNYLEYIEKRTDNLNALEATNELKNKIEKLLEE